MTSPAGIVDDLRRLAIVVAPTSVPRVVPTDPDDNHELAAARAGQVDLIDSGDKRDLLPLGSYQGIDIVTAREAISRLETRGETPVLSTPLHSPTPLPAQRFSPTSFI